MKCYLVDSIDEIPDGTRFRELSSNLHYFNNKMVIESDSDTLALLPAPANHPNGIPVVDEFCHAEFKIKEPKALPDVDETVNNMKLLANNKTLETSKKLKLKASVEELIGLINATDGYKIKKVD